MRETAPFLRFAPGFPQVVAMPFRIRWSAAIVASLSTKELQMFSELVAAYGPAMVAAAVLIPALVGHIAMFMEGVGERKWSVARTSA
jgi:hypothetical protein